MSCNPTPTNVSPSPLLEKQLKDAETAHVAGTPAAGEARLLHCLTRRHCRHRLLGLDLEAYGL